MPDRLPLDQHTPQTLDAVYAELDQLRGALDRDRIDAAIRPVMLLGLQDAQLYGAGGEQRIGEWVDWIAVTIAALPAEVTEETDPQ